MSVSDQQALIALDVLRLLNGGTYLNGSTLGDLQEAAIKAITDYLKN